MKTEPIPLDIISQSERDKAIVAHNARQPAPQTRQRTIYDGMEESYQTERAVHGVPLIAPCCGGPGDGQPKSP
jgi:hypothetical protein